MTKAVISTGEVYLHGAHITSFQLPGQKPVLWTSKQSLFETGKAIRGGIPICFPWFGPRASNPQAPSHGFARTKPWQLASTTASPDGGVTLELQTTIEEFSVAFVVSFGQNLKMSLQVSLPSSASNPATFEAALHTYLTISDIRNVAIEGLESTAFIDKVDSAKLKPASGTAICFDGECDRVYLDTSATCKLRDKGFERVITVSKSNSQSTIVWNPWIVKSEKMTDFGDDEWKEMVCIESANVASNSVELNPGESHTMSATIESDSITLPRP